MSAPIKRYGLQLPQKFVPGQMKPKLAIFNEESSESDSEEGNTALVNKALKKQSIKTLEKKQTKLDMAKALQEDPTVYQYDEVFDEIERKREDDKNKIKKDRQPKYIHSLLKQAERRKREQERRTELQVQKEREAEGDQFKDKEAFITSSYREKLEEFKKMEEEERYQDQLEALTDVSKQDDLSGFYRHLYRQTVSGENNKPTMENSPPKEIEIKEEPHSNEEVAQTENESSSNNEETDIKFTKRKRRYRERKSSSSSQSSDDQNKKKLLDADSESSSSSSSSSETDTEETKETKKTESKNISKKEELKDHTEIKDKKSDESTSESSPERTNKTEKPKKKIDIWKKRTVDDVLLKTLERYNERKKILLKKLEMAGNFQESAFIKPEKYIFW